MPKLEIVFDTETTGVSVDEGHRVVEIGCVELDNLIPTGRTYHTYINPERDMPLGAYQVHGLSAEFLSDKPTFSQVADAFLEFVGDKPLVAHNADFDFKFINAELDNIGRAPISDRRKIDSWKMAQRAFPGQASSLDALCRRFEVDLSARTKHGALLDAELLAEVYLNLKGGRQTRLDLMGAGIQGQNGYGLSLSRKRMPVAARTFAVDEDELARHKAFVADMPDAIWARYDEAQ
ncbi:MAG: DNA polymerase III subunit epsilon [Pseudomonadota bacterium]